MPLTPPLLLTLLLAACTAGASDRPPHVQRVNPLPITHPISNFAPNVVFDITAGAGVATDRTPVFTVNGTEVELTWNVVEDRGFALLSTAERLGPSPEVDVFEVRYWDNNGREFTYGWNVTTAGGPGVPAPPTPTP